MTESSWQTLLTRVWVRRADLVQDFLDEFARQGSYPVTLVSEEDVRLNARDAIDVLLLNLTGQRLSPAQAQLTDTLGRRRARQGVPLAQFLEAVRIDFRVLWRAIERASRPDLLESLVENGERVLDVVERYASEVQRAYLEEEHAMAQRQRTSRERALATVFAEAVPLEELQGAAQALGVRLTAEFEVLAVPDGGPPAPEGSLGRAVAYRDRSGVIWLRERAWGERQPWVPETPGLRGGVVVGIPGLGAVRSGARLAWHLAETPHAAGVVDARRGYLDVVRAGHRESFAGFESLVIGGFADLGQAEQARLWRTLQVFADCGSAQLTADRLFCHRNTVVKRLRALEQATGLDPSRPRDLAIALLALPDPELPDPERPEPGAPGPTSPAVSLLTP
ncbi:helix-turn-helix domain-containing protein [Leucobacter sp. M11]|uniref:helix-turn-helix domain-containing protein n=1 Tax=Leucobacter sp. M11 TaxID=2993565 RepID=UPI002D7ED6BF|nr:helix-turn-helix domain-containing protein [Leucobacter sp. M11]MEB4614608.1 helix-turn-helix domain-containing protein [Leucobacter sp. M11]